MDILGTGVFAVVSSLVTWAGTAYAYRDRKKEKAQEQDAGLQIHKDNMLFELLQIARQEIQVARIELREARDEIKVLRPLEQDFYHVEQALDLFDALLSAETAAERKMAERNARGFVSRIRRLHAARGTIVNEVQRAASALNVAARKIGEDPE